MSKPKLNEQDYGRAAARIRCDVPAIKAVAEVESRGEGFYADGFPVILFERHKFREFTGGKYTRSHPDISGPAGGYGAAGAHQRKRFNEAFALDPDAAMKSCSWGKFQIMGFNHKICGFATVGEFVDAMKESEGRHLDAFVSFVIANKLDRHLRSHNWADFAEGYNGEDYRKNKYDSKMAEAWHRFSKRSTAVPATDGSLIKSNSIQNPANDGSQGQSSIPASLVPVPTPVVEVETVTAAPTEPKPDPKEDAMTRIGNKANAMYTMFGTLASGIIAWFSGAATAIVFAVMGAAVILGFTYMVINAIRASQKDKRDRAERLELEKIAADEREKREARAHEIQMLTLKAAADPNLYNVRLVPPPPTTEVPNSDSPEGT